MNARDDSGEDSTGQATYVTHAPRVQANGYIPIPCDGKKPIGIGWTNRTRYDPFEGEIYCNANLGILTKHAPFLDIDITDPELAGAVLEYLRTTFPELQQALERTGKAPKCGFLLRTDAPFRKLQQTFHRGEETCKIEWLADGQQFIAFGIHPDTGRLYYWNGQGSPLDVHWQDLPPVDEARAREILRAVSDFVVGQGWLMGEGVSGTREEGAKGEIAQPGSIPPMPALEGVPAAVLACLDLLDPSPYEQWTRVGHYLKAFDLAGVDWDAKHVFEVWSQRSPKYQPGDEDRFDTYSGSRISAPEYGLRKLAGLLDDPLAGFEDVPPHWRVPALEFAVVHREDLPPFPYAVEGIVPIGVPTLFSAHGGSGKSYVSLQLAVCGAAGLDFFGHRIARPLKVLVYTCEEPEHEVKLRLKRILSHYMLEPADLGGRLEIRNGYGHLGNILFTGTRDPGHRLTAPFAEFYQYVKQTRPDMVIVDNISEVYDASEIDRALVRQFVQSMNQICKLGAALVLVGHVDAATSLGTTEKGYSGSTAWHNSVRSRLFLRKTKVEGQVLLEPAKSNYGPVQPAMLLQWHKEEKVFTLISTVEAVKAMPIEQGLGVVMSAIAAREAKGLITTSTVQSAGSGLRVLVKELGQTREQVIEILTELRRRGWITEAKHRDEVHRKTYTVWTVTDLGRANMVVEVPVGGGVSAGGGSIAERGKTAERPKGQSPELDPANVYPQDYLSILE